jgi:hypothetical protein
MKLHSPRSHSTLVYYDNVSVVYLASNPVQHQCTKYVEIDLHFSRNKVAIGEVHVLYFPMTSQFADIFTKGLPSPLFSEFRSSLNICRAYSWDWVCVWGVELFIYLCCIIGT